MTVPDTLGVDQGVAGVTLRNHRDEYRKPPGETNQMGQVAHIYIATGYA